MFVKSNVVYHIIVVKHLWTWGLGREEEKGEEEGETGEGATAKYSASLSNSILDTIFSPTTWSL